MVLEDCWQEGDYYDKELNDLFCKIILYFEVMGGEGCIARK